MTVQEYIDSKIEDLKNPSGAGAKSGADLPDEILRLVLSKKFRKYSVGEEPLAHITSSINGSVQRNEPIKFTLPFGAYKLWRLDESPEPDWAELFTLIYFANWLKPVCEIYEPGVWFDFFSDDVIIPRMNNIPSEDLAAYKVMFEKLLLFIKPSLPKNLKMTLSRVIDQYDSQDAFEEDFEHQTEEMKERLKDGLPSLDDAQKAMIELNAKPTKLQMEDSKWREKIALIHDSYVTVSGRRPYYRPIEQRKIMVVCTPLWGMLTVGSTKDSTMKFWVGAGVLKPRDDEFRQYIMSPSQLAKAKFEWQDLHVKGISGKNFNKIRVIQ